LCGKLSGDLPPAGEELGDSDRKRSDEQMVYWKKKRKTSESHAVAEAKQES
jgi:hypothetical protein